MTKYKFAISQGNNSNVVRKCLLLRSEQWEETSHSDKLFNFKWLPLARGILYNQMNAYGVKQLVNHVSGHEQLTTKDKLFENLTFYCEQNKLDVF